MWVVLFHHFLNVVSIQDFPQRSPTTSACVQRERRRRHYYAREDSDEEEVGCSEATQELLGDDQLR